MNLYESVYKSLIYHVTSIVPPNVFVLEGENYGINLDDGTQKSPSVTVTINDVETEAIEIGSFGTDYRVIYTVTARSRVQRDALKYMVYSGLLYNTLCIYNNFDEYTPASGALIVNPAQFDDTIIIKDTPNFSSDREKFFWVSAVIAEVHVIG